MRTPRPPWSTCVLRRTTSAGFGERFQYRGGHGRGVLQGTEVAEAVDDLRAGVGEAGRLQFDQGRAEGVAVASAGDDRRAVDLGELGEGPVGRAHAVHLRL